MRDVLRDRWYDINAPWEGVVDHFYADIKQLVTIGVGNLVDPVEVALQLPMRHRVGGALASRADIAADWHRVKDDLSMARLGHRAARLVTKLYLPEADVRLLVARKAEQMWRHLAGRWPVVESWPADAQCALLSQAWALGPAFRWPMLEAAIRASHFALCAVECKMREDNNPGVKPRNKANRLMWSNAGLVDARNMDRDVLHYPRDVASEAPTLTTLPAPADDSEPFAIVHPKVPLGRPALDGDDDPGAA